MLGAMEITAYFQSTFFFLSSSLSESYMAERRGTTFTAQKYPFFLKPTLFSFFKYMVIMKNLENAKNKSSHNASILPLSPQYKHL